MDVIEQMRQAAQAENDAANRLWGEPPSRARMPRRQPAKTPAKPSAARPRLAPPVGWRTLVDFAEEAECDVGLIVGRNRRPWLVAVRHAAMARLREIGMSLTDIGIIMGRDHTSVIHGLRRHAERTGGKQ